MNIHSDIGSHPHARTRRTSRLIQWLVAIVVLLIVVRIALPFAVAKYVNRKLNEAHDYGGQICTVRMQLWRGGYQIEQIKIFKKTGAVKTPLFSADELDLSIEWSELFHGAVVGKVILRKPQVNFVSGPTEAQSQSGKDQGWDKMLESLFPFDLNRLDIKNGEVHFQNQYSKPPVDIYLSKIEATATNLNNTRGLTQKLPSGVVVS